MLIVDSTFALWFVVIMGLILMTAVAIKKHSAQAAGKIARTGDVRCPACKEFIRGDAEVCRHCGLAIVQLKLVPLEDAAAGMRSLRKWHALRAIPSMLLLLGGGYVAMTFPQTHMLILGGSVALVGGGLTTFTIIRTVRAEAQIRGRQVSAQE